MTKEIDGTDKEGIVSLLTWQQLTRDNAKKKEEKKRKTSFEIQTKGGGCRSKTLLFTNIRC